MYIEIYRLLGKTFLEARRYADAADIFQRALMAVPDDFVSHVGMSIIRAKGTQNMGNVVVISDRSDLEVYADPLFDKVFYNLIENALVYGGEQLTTIRISTSESDNDLVIVCEDDGAGVDPEEKENIFRKGFGKDSGLGLFLIREILSITAITIQETGEPGKGARFEILVPEGDWRITAP